MGGYLAEALRSAMDFALGCVEMIVIAMFVLGGVLLLLQYVGVPVFH
ncbi:hypothetical protein [Yinghuangia seranimata]|nr:hypothetical protein [Yinghuangia seranimata]MDI2129431.1 hypothetical protein [Yinghuangia seranimata]